MSDTKPAVRTVTMRPFKKTLQFWLIQDGVTNPDNAKWRITVSQAEADNDKDALDVAQSRYREGYPSEEMKTEAA